MLRLSLVIPFALFAALGCGGSTDQWKEVAENARRNQEAEDKALRGIADDSGLPEADAIKKYLDSSPTVPKNLPPDVAPGWAANQINNQWHLVVHAMLQSQSADSSPDERMRKERNTVRWHMAGSRRMLDHLKGRKVQSVTVSIYTKLTGQEKHTELFRAVMTQADVAKSEKNPDGVDFHSSNNPQSAEEGTVYDPRGPKIGDCWTVELNRYPDLEYKKR
jgi:hypothetical protein